MGSTLALAAAAALVAAAVWKLLHGGLRGAVFVIEVQGEGPSAVELRGTVPGKDDADVRDFVAHLELPVGSRVWALREGSQLTLRFSPHVPPNLQQRTRNYVYN